jgi:hypothetical protein
LTGSIIKDENEMEIKKGNLKTAHAGFRALILSSLALTLTACVHWPDIASDCESYGVVENRQPMGDLMHIEPLYSDELNSRCSDVKVAIAMINPDAQIKGCVIPEANGVVSAYYSVGDRCAQYHEMCHAMHGGAHTERYMRELEQGIPMPYCPENQSRF